MTAPYIGEIRMFLGNFAPRGWALCDGQLLPISGHSVLFSVLGTTYGGDGRTTFALPDLRGRLPIHAGNGPGLSNRNLGAKGGVESVTLSASQIAPHTHTLNVRQAGGNANAPANNVHAADASGFTADYHSGGPDGTSTMHPNAIGASSGGSSHENMPPFLCVHFIVAINGLIPTRN